MTSNWTQGAAGGGASSAETAFEFPRDVERFVHERVLSGVRARQRSSLRPGVTAAGRAVDVLRHERTTKRLARALRVLREDLDVAEPLAREALCYSNGLEDALRFLTLQFESDELPRSLRALPGVVRDDTRASGESDGELVVAVTASAPVESGGRDGGDDVVDRAPVASQSEVADSWDDLVDDNEGETTATPAEAAPPVAAPSEPAKSSALSWTQQYLQVIAEREEEEARAAAAFAKLSPDEKLVLELEAQFRAVFAAVEQAKADKVSKKKQKALAYELQALRQRLSERGWSESEFHARESSSSSAGVQDDAKHDRAAVGSHSLASELETEREERDATQEAPAGAVVEDADEADENYGGSLFDNAPASSKTATPATATATAAVAGDEPVSAESGSGSASTATTRRGKGGKKMKAAGRTESNGRAATVAWTGKSPRDHIHDYCKKSKLPMPVYKKVAMRSRTHVYTLVLDFKTHKTEYVLPDEGGAKAGFASIDVAKDTVATHALYALSPDLPLYRVLPPAYRDLWLDWVRAREKEAVDAVSLEKEGFDAVVSAILAQIPDEVRANVVAAPVVVDETESVMRPTATAKATLHSEGESDDDEDASGAASNVLADWAVDDWDADLSDAEPTRDDDEHAHAVDDTASAAHDVERDDPAALAYSQQLSDQLRHSMRSRAFTELWSRRQDLPITAFKTSVLAALETHNVVLISGETGCGKSTQVPQFLLEDMLLTQQQGARCQIVCTQPRRLAAISLAERVSQELGEPAMGAGDSLCGFQIRLEARRTAHTRLLFCTTGILLRRLQDAATLASDVSHIIVDEVHERDLQNDVLLSMLRQFLSGANQTRQPPLKVLLMSATLNAASFQAYFGGEHVCPMLTVPGRTFPVQELFLEDVLELTEYVIDDTSPAYIPYESVQQSTQVKVSGRGGTSVSQRVYWEAPTSLRSRKRTATADGDDGERTEYSARTLEMLDAIDASVINYELIQELLEHVVTKSALVQLSDDDDTQPSASILVFLPGLHEISTLLDLLGGHRLFRDERRFSLLPLHSSLSPTDQQRIFRQPRGVVRIIATTNIAETSLTVEDAKVVIDTGRVKEMRHNAAQRTSVLDEIWIARANAKQRMGRAGRTSGGVCYRLFPRVIYRSTMDAQPVPEIQRAPLTSLCLQLKSFGVVSCRDFLSSCLDPPDDASVIDALLELVAIGALERTNETLTTLGQHLARLPVDVKVGKLLLLGAVFDVFDPIATSAAILETRSPFVAPYGHQSEMQTARKRFAVAQSDLLTDVNAYEAWRTQFHNRNSSSSRMEREFCRQHFLSHRSLLEITKLKQQFHGLVAQAGYLPLKRPVPGGKEGSALTRAQLAMTAAILYAGLAPNLVHVERATREDKKPRQRLLLRDQDHTLVAVHPSSINFQNGTLASAFLTYAVKLHTSQIYLPTSSIVFPAAVCVFSHSLELLPTQRSGSVGLRVNDWVVFQSSYRSAVLLQELRDLVAQFIATRMARPQPLDTNDTNDNDIATMAQEHAALKRALGLLFESEYDVHDPKHALSRQLSSAPTQEGAIST